MSAQIHGLMTYSQVMQVVVFVWLADRAVSQPPRSRKIQASTFRRAISVAAAAILGLTSVLYARFDNQCYLKAIFQQQQAISFFTALAAQIKAAPGFKDDTPVVFLNEGSISDRTPDPLRALPALRRFWRAWTRSSNTGRTRCAAA
jgi:hypothetical protein